MPKQESLHAWLGTMRITSLLGVGGWRAGRGKEAGRAGRPPSALWGSEAGLGPAMLPAQAGDAAATALPARPAHSCSLYLPPPGTRRPPGDGAGGLWIWPGPGTPTAKGRPLVPSAHAGALATEGRSEKTAGPAARPRGFPRGAKIPRPQSPQWGASQDAPHPKALSCNPTSRMRKRRPSEREGRSTHAPL